MEQFDNNNGVGFEIVSVDLAGTDYTIILN